VIVEGKRTATRLGVPSWPAGNVRGLPVGDASFVHLTETAVAVPTRYQRIGTQYFETISATLAAADPTKNPPTTVTTFAVTMAEGRVEVADGSQFPAGSWIQLGDQIVGFSKAGANTLMVPLSGYGALQAPAPVNTTVVLLAGIEGYGLDRYDNPAFPYYWQTRVALRPQPFDTPVVLVAMQQDQPTAAAIGAREGSDGYYEHLVQDGRFLSAGALARAAAELTNFAAPLVAYEWETDDLNVEPGRIQQIRLTRSPAVTADVRITNVEVTPIAKGERPRRVVRAAAVQAASVLDTWVDDAR
jgi:hypothetical protein